MYPALALYPALERNAALWRSTADDGHYCFAVAL
jgi:hypothetical protein